MKQKKRGIKEGKKGKTVIYFKLQGHDRPFKIETRIANQEIKSAEHPHLQTEHFEFNENDFCIENSLSITDGEDHAREDLPVSPLVPVQPNIIL